MLNDYEKLFGDEVVLKIVDEKMFRSSGGFEKKVMKHVSLTM
jgi:hypothetical protein